MSALPRNWKVTVANIKLFNHFRRRSSRRSDRNEIQPSSLDPITEEEAAVTIQIPGLCVLFTPPEKLYSGTCEQSKIWLALFLWFNVVFLLIPSWFLEDSLRRRQRGIKFRRLTENPAQRI